MRSPILRAICAIVCVTQSIQPAVQLQLPTDRINSMQPSSPCPEYLKLEIDPMTKELRGRLSIPPPQNSSVITVDLRLRVNGDNTFSGSIEPTEDKGKIFQQLKEGNFNPVVYNIIFPAQNATPQLTSIIVNRQSICQNHTGIPNDYQTELALKHEIVSPYLITDLSSNSRPDNGVDSTGQKPLLTAQKNFSNLHKRQANSWKNPSTSWKSQTSSTWKATQKTTNSWKNTTPWKSATTKWTITTPWKSVTTQRTITTPWKRSTTKRTTSTPWKSATTKRTTPTPWTSGATQRTTTTPWKSATTKWSTTTPWKRVTTKWTTTTPWKSATTKWTTTTPWKRVTTKWTTTTPWKSVTTQRTTPTSWKSQTAQWKQSTKKTTSWRSTTTLWKGSTSSWKSQTTQSTTRTPWQSTTTTPKKISTTPWYRSTITWKSQTQRATLSTWKSATTQRTTEATWKSSRAYPISTKQPNTIEAPSDTDRFDSCGVSHEVTNLIINGDTVAKGAWPWLSAIYKVEETCFTFICGGTLVTKRHVVTAAHCVLVTQGKADLMQPEKILIFLGKYNILNIIEQDSKSKEISGITIHPKYTGRLFEYAGIDLAILTFKSPTTFGPYIKPVCLWDSTKQYAKTGKVVGWGRDEYGRPSKAPKQVDMPIVSNEQCIKADPNFAKITSDTTFCAGFRNGSGPCKGDSGGGLYLWDQETRKWSIRGIISQALLDHEKQSCDLKNYVTFTDVSKLLDWIKKMIQQ
ncbi:serine proteinase stubble-like isoform X2 [Cloeon dipterum]|uniref:serine proteinase stubble-like isoform X2 n=1 Tax=Cloeon dipterum TaxID=197152 RepID=UPI00321FD51D